MAIAFFHALYPKNRSQQCLKKPQLGYPGGFPNSNQTSEKTVDTPQVARGLRKSESLRPEKAKLEPVLLAANNNHGREWLRNSGCLQRCCGGWLPELLSNHSLGEQKNGNRPFWGGKSKETTRLTGEPMLKVKVQKQWDCTAANGVALKLEGTHGLLSQKPMAAKRRLILRHGCGSNKCMC